MLYEPRSYFALDGTDLAIANQDSAFCTLAPLSEPFGGFHSYQHTEHA
jgi:hypothetical protein